MTLVFMSAAEQSQNCDASLVQPQQVEINPHQNKANCLLHSHLVSFKLICFQLQGSSAV